MGAVQKRPRKARAEIEVHSEQIVEHQNLAIASGSSPDTDGGDMERRGEDYSACGSCV